MGKQKAIRKMICRSWQQDFQAFYRHMGDRPEGTFLRRIDRSKPYSKKNCVWATREELMADTPQVKNRKSVIQSLDGVVITEWVSAYRAAKETGIGRSGIYHCCHGDQKLAGGFSWKFA